MRFSLKVRNYRGLREIDWSPAGVCALVGASGSGKTTLLDVPALLRDALERGLARALEDHGGIANARNLYAPSSAPYDFRVGTDAIYWQMAPMETASGFRPEETVTEETRSLVRREGGADSALLMDVPVTAQDTLALRVVIDELSHPLSTIVSGIDTINGIIALGKLLSRYRLYAHYDLRALRRSGSADSSERRLTQDGSNVFSVLRNWRDKKEDRHRYSFVIDALRELFQGFFEDLDFSKAAQVIGAELRLRGDKVVSASLAPDGWFAALLHLTAVASTNSGDLIAIDEPENALHPHAIKRLLQHMRSWAQRHSTTILLATHSPVIIDAFRECPERLYIMEPAERSLPIPLNELKDPEWLAHFSLGDLYAREEFGAPSDGDEDRPHHDR
jgi:predicted ATPase